MCSCNEIRKIFNTYYVVDRDVMPVALLPAEYLAIFNQGKDLSVLPFLSRERVDTGKH